jgi:hypothetical protein
VRYFASKTHDRLNGAQFNPEDQGPVCINPYYKVTIRGPAPFIIDSGAFQDVGTDSRLTPEEALRRQLDFERTVTPEGRPAYAIVSYDRLVDEQRTEDGQIKRRVTEEQGEEYVRETIEAARFLVSRRAELAPRRLILSCQGTTAEQYIGCLREVLQVAAPQDIIGLGGFCIISRSKEAERQFYEVIARAFPMIAEAGIRDVHIFGVGILRVLIRAETEARAYGIMLSYDTSNYEVNAVFGRVFDPAQGQLTRVFEKAQKGKDYTPAQLARFNIRMVRAFWEGYAEMEAEA